MHLVLQKSRTGIARRNRVARRSLADATGPCQAVCGSVLRMTVHDAAALTAPAPLASVLPSERIGHARQDHRNDRRIAAEQNSQPACDRGRPVAVLSWGICPRP